jgi:hypothetical protein
VFFAVRSRQRGSTLMTSEWITDLGEKSLGEKGSYAAGPKGF